MIVSRAIMRMVAMLLFVGLLLPGTVGAADNSTENEVYDPTNPDLVMIGLEPGISAEEAASVLEGAGLRLERYWPRMAVAAGTPLVGASGADTSVDSLAQSAYAAQAFRYVAGNDRVYAANTLNALPQPPLREPEPNDTLYSSQWALPLIRAVDAWNIGHGDGNVIVAVIDSGYDVDHSDFAAGSIWANQPEIEGEPGVDDDRNGYIDDFNGWDWVDYDNNPDDENGHGTHVMGVVGATTGNGIDVAGIGRNLRVMPLRMLDERGSGSVFDLVDAVDYAIDKKVAVINLSVTIGNDNYAVRDAVKAAHSAGISVIAAAGNSGKLGVLWPAAYGETVAVAATDLGDKRSTFSSYGPEVDVAAPGTSIIGLWTNDGVRTVSGTSMATPHVAGLFGLLRSLRPDLSHEELVEIVKSAADDVNVVSYPGEDIYLGAGRIDVYNTLLQASTGLSLRPTPTILAPVVVGEPLDLRLRVLALSELAAQSVDASDVDGLSVAGAVAYARVFADGGDADAAEVVPAVRALTDSDGYADLTILSPDQIGDYRVRVQVGAAVTDLPLTVVDGPVTIQLAVASPVLTAGDGRTEYVVKLLDEEGDPVTDDVPVHLTTSAGEFDGGATEIVVTTQNGIYTGTLHAGTIAASGLLSAAVGGRTQTAAITVLPDAPARIHVVLADEVNTATETEYIFEVIVRDRFGNLVADGTEVGFTTTAGDIQPSQTLATAAGRARFRVLVPKEYVPIFTVTAVVVGSEVSDSTSVPPERLWLPLTQK